MGSTPPTMMSLSPGDWIHRYELLYPVAQGGMGAVWAARLQSMNSFERLFAVKLILPEHTNDPDFRAMFLDEARITAGVVHPNVAQVIDLGEQQGMLYIVMEWLDGDSTNVLIQEAIKRSMLLPLPVSLRIVAEACAGLHAAHELRDPRGVSLEVVHRDVSPHNILVTSDGTVKVIDFGIAKARDRTNITTSGAVKGKLRYMAPEQALGDAIDRRADVWGLGVILYQLVTGYFPYDGVNEVALLQALLSRTGRSPVPTSVPPVIAQIIDRALAFDVQNRFETALKMKHAIESAIERLGLRASTTVLEEYYRAMLSERMAARQRSLEIAKRAARERLEVRRTLEAQRVVHIATPSPPDAMAAIQAALSRDSSSDEHMAVHQSTPPLDEDLWTRRSWRERPDEGDGTFEANTITVRGEDGRRRRKVVAGVVVGAVTAVSMASWGVVRGVWQTPPTYVSSHTVHTVDETTGAVPEETALQPELGEDVEMEEGVDVTPVAEEPPSTTALEVDAGAGTKRVGASKKPQRSPAEVAAKAKAAKVKRVKASASRPPAKPSGEGTSHLSAIEDRK